MDEFTTYRSLLFSIAYRMTGSASEADDIVQEAYLRYCTAATQDVRSLKAYLTTIVTHLCLDYLKSARVLREQYVGPWLPEPLLTAESSPIPLETIEQRESISQAFLVLLEALTPPERAAFLLHEVFEYSFQEIAEIIDKSPANCRQLFHRAKDHLAERKTRFEPSAERQHQLLTRFMVACQYGQMEALRDMLAQDVVSWTDGGGKVRAAIKPIYGCDRVARFWLGLAHKFADEITVTLEEVNGSFAALLWDGELLTYVFTCTIMDEKIQAIRVISNPDKLVYIQRQLELIRTPDAHKGHHYM